MLSAEYLPGNNLRCLRLTQELIEDMLRNEGNEHQTPPGGHILYSSEDDILADDTESLSSGIAIIKRCYGPILYSDSESTHSSRAPTTDSDEESFEDLLDILLANRSKTSNKQPEFMCLRPSQTHLIISRLDDLIRGASQEPNEEKGLDMNHQIRTKQNWINMFVVPKSETSLLLNRSKMQNPKIGGCNAYYTPDSQDLWQDQQAVLSLFPGPSCQRNSKNADSWRK